jgi:hypothetical protein
MPEDLLPILYQRVADMTSAICASGRDECSRFCGRQYRCCEHKYCDLAARFAREKYGIELQPTGNPELPFMGEDGCTIPPYLRPICAIHVCTVSWAAKSHVENDPEKFRQYMSLRKQIGEEAQRQGKEAVNDVD